MSWLSALDGFCARQMMNVLAYPPLDGFTPVDDECLGCPLLDAFTPVDDECLGCPLLDGFTPVD